MDPVLIFLMAFAAIFVVGIAGEVVFTKTNVPDVVWLMLVGVLLGPVFGLVDREELMTVGPYFGAITLVIVLFEGGRALRLGEVTRVLPRSALLAVSSFLLTVAVLAGASMGAASLGVLPRDWTWLHGIILGAILGGSSSVVIMPALSKAKLAPKLSNLVSVESALTDVLCVVVTIAVIQLITSGSSDPGTALALLGKSSAIGLGIGALTGLLSLLFLRALKDSPHGYAATLSTLLVLYVVVSLLDGNAALAILAASVIVGNAASLGEMIGLSEDSRLSEGVGTTHTQITFIVKSFFFTFIGAMLGPPWGLVVFGALLGVIALLARLPAVAVACLRSEFSASEKAMVAITLPRGMAAGVLALMPYDAGVVGTEQLPVPVFAAVLTTILIFAAGFPIVKRRLNAVAKAFPARPPAVLASAVDASASDAASLRNDALPNGRGRRVTESGGN